MVENGWFQGTAPQKEKIICNLNLLIVLKFLKQHQQQQGGGGGEEEGIGETFILMEKWKIMPQ